MRITQNRIPIIVAAFVAFLLGAMPQPAHAQGIGGFSSSDCFNQMQNGYNVTGQANTVATQKVITNGPIPSFKVVYCWTTIIQPLLNSISSLTTDFSAAGSAISAALTAMLQSILTSIVTQLINTICGIVTSAVTGAIQMLKSWMCIPIPHFNLGLNWGGFKQALGGLGNNHSNCSGMNLMSLAGVAFGGRPTIPSVYSIFGMHGQF